MIWAIVSRRQGTWKRIKAAPPCWKGEVEVPLLWRWSLTIGWHRKVQEEDDDGKTDE